MVVRYKGTFDSGKTFRKPTDHGFRRKDHEKFVFSANLPKSRSRPNEAKKLPPAAPELQSGPDVN